MMEEESVTESESSSSESSSGSDWSENERKKRQQGRKSKMTKRKYSRQSLKKRMEKKSHLPVTCGDKGGYLYLQKFSNDKKCILSEGRWFNPSKFEKFGGKEKSKKWKNSIYYRDVPLQKLIEDECISCPVLKKRRNQHEESESRESSPVADRLRKTKSESRESSPVAGRLRKTKARRKLFPSDSESEYSVHNENNHNDNSNEDIIYVTEFKDPTLPVTSSSLTGHVHKNRFGKDQKLIPSDMEKVKATETKQALISGPTSIPKIPQPDTAPQVPPQGPL
ncbi:uncharacterized protein [Paramisgurnus dabryanus]|uniref:uncharacterized protein isoform X2 n=1 Tax=Paramisgurnus dabryanus TaxID=90735 RepID=UPI0031F42593